METNQAPQPGAGKPRFDLRQMLAALRRNRRLAIVIAVFVLAVLVVGFLALAGGNPLVQLRRLFHHGQYGTITFDAHTNNGYAAFDGGLAVGTISGLFTYDLYNEESNAVQSGMSTPLLKSGEDTVLACDIGGSTICAVKKGKGTVFQDRLDGTILDADLADDGALCYALATKSDKTLLTVLDAEQNEIYRWYSETAYFNQCAVSSSGTNLAGIRLGQQNNDFLSTAVLFRTDREEPVAELALGNALYLDLAFLASRTLCAIGENDAVFFSIDGKQTGIYDYEGAYLTHYSLDGSGFVAVATNHNRTGGTPVLTTLDTAGKPIASLELAGEILDLSAAGNYLAVLTTKGLTIYNARLKVCGQTADTSTASRVVARSDGTALLVSGDRAELFAG